MTLPPFSPPAPLVKTSTPPAPPTAAFTTTPAKRNPTCGCGEGACCSKTDGGRDASPAVGDTRTGRETNNGGVHSVPAKPPHAADAKSPRKTA
jgi:hypothetical protein